MIYDQLVALRRPGEVAVLALIGFLFLAHVIGLAVADRSITNGQIIAGDGLFYYEYLPSLILDGDLNFENQRAAARKLGVPYDFDTGQLAKTRTGLLGNPYPIGWALLTSPFFVIGHALALALAAVGVAVRLDGYSLIDQFVTNLGAVIYGLSGIYLCYRSLREFFDEAISGAAVVAFVLCSNLPYYVVVHASLSHAVSFFCMAWSTFAFIKLVRNEGGFALFGVAAGLTFLSRSQVAPVIGLFFLALLWQRPKEFGRLVGSAVICGAIATIQLLVWKTIYGSFITVPYGDNFLQPLDPHLLGVLFSLKHGFITWTPFVAVGIIGLVFGAIGANYRLIHITFLLGFASEVYINSIAVDWWGGNSFGYRRLIEVYPLLMFGLAWLMAISWPSFVTLTVLAIFCAAFNALFFVQYRFCYIPRGEAITFKQLLIDKLYLYKLDRPYCESRGSSSRSHAQSIERSIQQAELLRRSIPMGVMPGSTGP